MSEPLRLTRKRKLPAQTEKQVQAEVKELLSICNVVAYDTSQPFRAAITPGVPDLLCFGPRHGFFVVEVKRPGGAQSAAQKQFQHHCERAGVPYVLGGVFAVLAFLAVEPLHSEAA